jgi:hypothetical protein
MINPDIILRNCTIGQVCSGSINASFVHYYSIEYTFNPIQVRIFVSDSAIVSNMLHSKAVRITTHVNFTITQDTPILVVVRQARDLMSWTLPYTFTNG